MSNTAKDRAALLQFASDRAKARDAFGIARAARAVRLRMAQGADIITGRKTVAHYPVGAKPTADYPLRAD